MDEYQIADEAIQHLDHHVRGIKGAFSQEPYTGDFFRVFAKAYNAGLGLTADRLLDLIVTRWPDEPFDEKERQKIFERFYIAWADWKYAWDHLYLKTKAG